MWPEVIIWMCSLHPTTMGSITWPPPPPPPPRSSLRNRSVHYCADEMSSLPPKLCTSPCNWIELGFISHGHLIINDADDCSLRGSGSVQRWCTHPATAATTTASRSLLKGCLGLCLCISWQPLRCYQRNQITDRYCTFKGFLFVSLISFSFISCVFMECTCTLGPACKWERLPLSGPSCPPITALAVSLSEWWIIPD